MPFVLSSLVFAIVAAVYAVFPTDETWFRARRGESQSQRIHGDLEMALNQVYRSFELDDEVAAYDRISKSVAGEATRDIYLQVRRSLLDEDGGRVLIEEVSLDPLEAIQWLSDDNCNVDATWFVRGTIGHYGHSHERVNRYRARIQLVSQDGAWRIVSVQITEHDRER